eukprot:scaffold13853_cov147-Amphora_coffeaeformis.AAC.2
MSSWIQRGRRFLFFSRSSARNIPINKHGQRATKNHHRIVPNSTILGTSFLSRSKERDTHTKQRAPPKGGSRRNFGNVKIKVNIFNRGALLPSLQSCCRGAQQHTTKTTTMIMVGMSTASSIPANDNQEEESQIEYDDDDPNPLINNNMTRTRKPASSPGEESFDSVNLNPVPSAEDNEGIALLRQIFPEETTEELRRLHRKRVQRRSVQGETSSPYDGGSPSFSSPAAPSSRLLFATQTPSPAHNPLSHYKYHTPDLLPDDFLRLPADVAVRRYDPLEDRFRYELVADLDRKIKETLARDRTDTWHTIQTKVVFRDARVGLGLTLIEHRGQVRVYACLDYEGKEWHRTPPPKVYGPTLKAGITPGDVIWGLNGTLFTETQRLNCTLLRHAVETIRTAPDPVVIHFAKHVPSSHSSAAAQHLTTPQSIHHHPYPYDAATTPHTPALLDTTLHDLTIDESRSLEEISFGPMTFHSTPVHQEAVGEPDPHKMITTLVNAKIVPTKEQVGTQLLLTQFTERTRQWEALSCFRVKSYPDQDLFVPLMGIRKALCVRIVHSFTMSPSALETTAATPSGEMMAYTIWVYDTETGREFYAPVRTFADFCDLRAAVVALQSSLKQIDFPKRKSLFGSPIRESPEKRTRQLEYFLRVLCGFLYQGTLHESVAEIAIHVQSFLGCDAIDFTESPVLDKTAASVEDGNDDNDDLDKHSTRSRLKRSLQLYTYRLFLLPSLAEKVMQFVDHVRAREPDSMEVMEARGHETLKEQALGDLGRVNAFLDYLQDMILDGCMEDFVSIARREEYDAIHAIWHGNQGEVYWDRLVREAVREQVEIEVYVPLRSLLSRWLVKGWRHEDMEAHYKIKELRKRPQNFFRLPSARPTDEWMSASSILKKGVGQSTLPCVKLRAIVDAAQEISRIFAQKRAAAQGSSGSSFGADQFLPIFIFCVVQAEIDRPCALCVLLRSLCDRINKIGEIGYYLASFEAAVCHIQEIDLTEEQGQQMRSFLTVNLDSN